MTKALQAKVMVADILVKLLDRTTLVVEQPFHRPNVRCILFAYGAHAFSAGWGCCCIRLWIWIWIWICAVQLQASIPPPARSVRARLRIVEVDTPFYLCTFEEVNYRCVVR